MNVEQAGDGKSPPLGANRMCNVKSGERNTVNNGDYRDARVWQTGALMMQSRVA
jgi:hypothetical protein